MRGIDDKVVNTDHNMKEETKNIDLLHKSNPANRKTIGSRSKPTPSKWDDAQKWLSGLSNGGTHSGHGNKNKPRNSNADDRRLLNSASQKGRDSVSSVDLGLYHDINAIAVASVANSNVGDEGETKKMDCGGGGESTWRVSKPDDVHSSEMRLRDVGTEMTPIGSVEPSRTGTPNRVMSPGRLRSPTDSRSSSPGRYRKGVSSNDHHDYPEMGVGGVEKANGEEGVRVSSSVDSRAVAWDEAERAKYMARYKREELRIQAWENHEKRKAEMEMKRIEVKAERKKARAQEKFANKIAAVRRIAEEKRANAEGKLNEQAVKTSERADYIRRTGRLPFTFNISIKLPSLCG